MNLRLTSLNRFIFLILAILVVLSNYLIYHTNFANEILQVNSNSVVIATMIDLAIVLPLFLLAWRKNWGLKNFIFLSAAGLITPRFLIPLEYLNPFKAVTWIGFAIEGSIILIEISIVVVLFWYLPKVIRSVKKRTIPLNFAFPQAVEEKLKSTATIIKIVCSELIMLYYAFGLWRKSPPKNQITLHKNSSYIATQAMLIHAIVIETIVVHWLMHNYSILLSIILLILNIYAVILFVADIQAVRFHGIHTTPRSMYISLGLMKRMKIEWDQIEDVIQTIPPNKKTIEFIARDLEDVEADLILKLKTPTEAALFLGFKRNFQYVAIKSDDPKRLEQIILNKINYS